MRKLFLIFLIIIFFISFVKAECSGGADLDINKIERIPGQSSFKVVATANGNGDCLGIAWTKEQLDNIISKESPEESISRDITGDISLISQTETINTHSYETLYNYEIDYGGLIGYCENICANKGYPTTAPDGWAIRSTINCYCVHKTDVFGSVGKFGSKSFSDKVLFSFVDLPETTLDTSKGSVDIQNKISISYKGSLFGTKELSIPTDYGPFKRDGEVKLVSGSSSQATETRSELVSCLGNSGTNEAANSCISTYENKINSLYIKYNDF